MHVSQIKEDLSVSYISALCAKAGIAYEITHHDEDGCDGTLKKLIHVDGIGKFNSTLNVQLKCTSSKTQYRETDNTITYKLKAKSYNDLCTPSTNPLILALLILPEDENQWLLWSKEELIIKGCMYWADFCGETPSENETTVSVRIDKNNVLNSPNLHKILEKIARGEDRPWAME